MKVFILAEFFAEDYHTGGESIVGVFSTRDAAVEAAKKQFPQIRRKIEKDPKAEGWDLPSMPACDGSVGIQEWEVQ